MTSGVGSAVAGRRPLQPHGSDRAAFQGRSAGRPTNPRSQESQRPGGSDPAAGGACARGNITSLTRKLRLLLRLAGRRHVNHASGSAEVIQAFTSPAAALVDQQPAEFLHGQVFRCFASGHCTGDYNAPCPAARLRPAARYNPPMPEYRFFHPIEVRYGDLDPQGHVNNAKHLTYLSRPGCDTGPSWILLQRSVLHGNRCHRRRHPHSVSRAGSLGISPESRRADAPPIGNKSFTMEQNLVDEVGDRRYSEGSVVNVAFDYVKGTPSRAGRMAPQNRGVRGESAGLRFHGFPMSFAL